MKKRAVQSIALFLLALFVIYFALSFMVPGWRLKLSASPMTVLLENLRHMASLKLLITLPLSALITALPILAEKVEKAGKE